MEKCAAVTALKMNHNKVLQGFRVRLLMLLVISHRYTDIQCFEMHMWNGGRGGLNVQYVVLGKTFESEAIDPCCLIFCA